MKKIPISEAERLSNEYGYDQVIILALHKSKKPNWWEGWKATFNKHKEDCSFLGKVGDILAHNFRAYYSNKSLTETTHKKIPKYKE